MNFLSMVWMKGSPSPHSSVIAIPQNQSGALAQSPWESLGGSVSPASVSICLIESLEIPCEMLRLYRLLQERLNRDPLVLPPDQAQKVTNSSSRDTWVAAACSFWLSLARSASNLRSFGDAHEDIQGDHDREPRRDVEHPRDVGCLGRERHADEIGDRLHYGDPQQEAESRPE